VTVRDSICSELTSQEFDIYSKNVITVLSISMHLHES